MKKFLEFGRFSVKMLASLFFWVGSLGVAAASWTVGYSVALTFVWHRSVHLGDGWWTSVARNHLPLGIFAGLLCFLFGMLFWRLVCEAIYIVLNYFKENTQQK